MTLTLTLTLTLPPVGYGGKDKGGESAIADQWFESQKKFYVDMGKTLGDTVRSRERGRVIWKEERVG